MRKKELILYIIILTAISLSIGFLHYLTGIIIPSEFMDVSIMILVSISCYHYFKRYQFKVKRSIFQGMFIGTTAGLISGVVYCLTLYNNKISEEIFYYQRIVVFLTWFIEASLTATLISLLLTRIKK